MTTGETTFKLTWTAEQLRSASDSVNSVSWRLDALYQLICLAGDGSRKLKNGNTNLDESAVSEIGEMLGELSDRLALPCEMLMQLSQTAEENR